MSDSMKGSSLPRQSCSDWADLLALTPEELLSPADRVAFTEHARSCATCAALRDDSRLLTAFARRALSVTPLPGLPASVLAEMQNASSAPSDIRCFLRLRSPWLVAACLVIGLALVSLVWQLGFQTLIHQVQADPLSLQQSLKEVMPPPGATFVHTVSWSPDGKYIAVLWDDSTMQVRDAQHKYIVIFSQKVGWGYGLAWSPDGQRLASIGKEDNTIQIWNISTSQCEANMLRQCLIYTGHTAQIKAIAWSPNGSYIASASDDQTVQIWDARTMKHLYTYRDPGSTVTTIAWSPDGKRLASGDDNNHVQAWDALTGAHLVNYKGHKGAISFVGWSPDGNFILSSSYDGTVGIWNVRTGGSTLKLPPDPGPIFAADCLWEKGQQNSAFLALVVDNSIQIWHIWDQQGKIELQWLTTSRIANDHGQSDNVLSISWSPLEDHIIAGGSGDILDFRLE